GLFEQELGLALGASARLLHSASIKLEATAAQCRGRRWTCVRRCDNLLDEDHALSRTSPPTRRTARCRRPRLVRLGSTEGRARGPGSAGPARHPSPDEAWALAATASMSSSEDFEQYAQDALDSLPADLRAQMSNVEVVVEEEPPPGQRLLGLYEGVPLTRRSSSYGGVLPDKITIYRGPLMGLYARDPERLRR